MPLTPDCQPRPTLARASIWSSILGFLYGISAVGIAIRAVIAAFSILAVVALFVWMRMPAR
jgi:hypothetical protein